MKKILFVCLGNICRSPAAEAVFLDLLTSHGLNHKYEVDSAGTGAWHVGNKADARMRLIAQKRGISIKSIARQITKKDLTMFDYILTMDNDNFSKVIAMTNETKNHLKVKIFPLLSFSSSSNLTEVPDPYYGGEEGFEEVLNLLTEACEGFLDQMELID